MIRLSTFPWRARGAEFLLAFGLSCAFLSVPGAALGEAREVRSRAATSASPDSSIVLYEPCRTHDVGDIRLTISNYGIFGTRTYYCSDPCPPAPPPLEFPKGSGVNYLFQGALWIGGIRGTDTLVSVGADGWFLVEEMWPVPGPDGEITTRTTRDILVGDSVCPDVYFSPDAVSEQDLKTAFTDTVTNSSFVAPDPLDGPHVPLGIRVDQTSYAWSAGFARDYIIIDLRLTNLNTEPLQQVYVGLYMDQDVGHPATPETYSDDLSGFLSTAPSPLDFGILDTLNLAWTMDNDGDPRGGFFTSHSATGIAGVRVLRTPQPDPKTSFNWWVSSGNSARDWGPNRTGSTVPFPMGNLGTPVGDHAKYQMMSNGELDYDQVYTVMDHQADGWYPPPANPVFGVDIAIGYDTRYLLSCGPFDLAPGSESPLTFAVIAGERVHTDARNFTAFFDPSDPSPYAARLDFSDLVRNAQWTAKVFDNPGVDTDEDGYAGDFVIVAGDTIFVRGDGVPDFAGPPPPPAPVLHATVRDDSTVVVRFNGQRTETARDLFSLERDFEGYRIYLSTTSTLPSSFQFLDSRDIIDFTRHVWSLPDSDWVVLDRPFTLDSLEVLYDSLTLMTYGFPFHPDSFGTPDRQRALQQVKLDPIDPSKLDTTCFYFSPVDDNRSPDDSALVYQVDSLGQEVFGVIRKVFPFAHVADTLFRPDGTPFAPFYEYEYAVAGLGGVNYAYFAVTPFDFGFAPMGVEPQSAAMGENVVAVALRVRTGDVDEDGDVDVDDILRIVFYLFGRKDLPEPNLLAADADCDREVDLVDAVKLINYVFRGAPAPDCPGF